MLNASKTEFFTVGSIQQPECVSLPCIHLTEVTFVMSVRQDDVIKGNIFRVTGPLCGEFSGHRWIPLTKESDPELWCFLWSAPEKNDWVNNREAGDLRRHRVHYDVVVMKLGRQFWLYPKTDMKRQNHVMARRHATYKKWPSHWKPGDTPWGPIRHVSWRFSNSKQDTFGKRAFEVCGPLVSNCMSKEIRVDSMRKNRSFQAKFKDFSFRQSVKACGLIWRTAAPRTFLPKLPSKQLFLLTKNTTNSLRN